MNINELTIITCTFNNNIITAMMLKSLFKQLEDYKYKNVLIMDNGNKIYADNNLKSVFTIIDNTNFKITKNYNQVSKNHSSSIDYLLKNCVKTKYALLCDTDILYKPAIKTLLNDLPNDFDCVGEVGYDIIPPNRLFPYFCIINVEKFNKEKLNYFDENRCMRLWDKNGNELFGVNNGAKGLYDTGYSFYEDIKNSWNIININLSDYIVHLKGSYLGKDWKTWLEKNKELFC